MKGGTDDGAKFGWKLGGRDLLFELGMDTKREDNRVVVSLGAEDGVR
jgi:hypothetical protein